MVAMEADVLRWMSDLLGLPPTAAGILTSGGSTAVFSAIVCARSTKLPEDFRRGVIYATNQTHHVLAKALRLAFPMSVAVGSCRRQIAYGYLAR